MIPGVDYQYASTVDDYQRQMNAYVQQQHQPMVNRRFDPWKFENSWSHGLWDCTEQCDETCYGLWCFPCFACHLAWRMRESCWITCCLPSYLAVLRTKMRTAFRIEGSYLSDLCVAECCPLCAALQMAGELRARKVMR